MEYIKIQIKDEIIRTYVWKVLIIVDSPNSLFYNKRYMGVLNEGLSR